MQFALHVSFHGQTEFVRPLRLSLVVSSLVLLVAATQLNAQQLTGSVRDLASGQPVRGALVALITSDAATVRSVQTDSVGLYRITAPSAAAYDVRFSRIGFTPVEIAHLVFRLDSTLNRDVFLKPLSVKLAAVSISENPIVRTTLANPHKFDLFLERRARGVGFFMTHDQIEGTNTLQLQQLLQSVPGIKVRQIGTTWQLQSQHCSGRHIPGTQPDDQSRLPVVFIDGHFTKGIEQLELINPSQIEGLEVYQGGSQLPPEALGKACFAIFVWLRTIGR
jgi:hypothetical protein